MPNTQMDKNQNTIALRKIIQLPGDMSYMLGASLAELNLSPRAVGRLALLGTTTIDGLLSMTIADLYAMQGMGPVTVRDITGRLCEVLFRTHKPLIPSRVGILATHAAPNANIDLTWAPLTLRNDYETFASAGSISVSLVELSLASEVLKALQACGINSLTGLLDHTWEQVRRSFGDNAAQEIGRRLFALGNVHDRSCSLESFEILANGGIWGSSQTAALPVEMFVSEMKLQPDTKRLLHRNAILTVEQLVGAIDGRSKWLAYDKRAFEDVCHRLAGMGIDGENVLPDWQGFAADTLCEASLEDIAEEMRAVCGERGWLVLRLRYGIAPGTHREKPTTRSGGTHCGRTLDEVGLELGRTRERARQLGKAAIAKLARIEISSWRSLSATIAYLSEDAGGVVSAAEAAGLIGAPFYSSTLNADGMCRLIMDISSDFAAMEASLDYYRKASIPEAVCTAICRAARSVASDSASSISGDDLEKQVMISITQQGYCAGILTVRACLRAYGCYTPPVQKPPFLKDLIVDTLRLIGEPAHFCRITELVNNQGTFRRCVAPHPIQVCLSKRRALFVNTTPGVYGLVEWGIEDRRGKPSLRRRTIADIAFRRLVRLGKPATTIEVTQYVCKFKPCNLKTVYNGLSRDNRFQRCPDGFGLKEWFP